MAAMKKFNTLTPREFALRLLEINDPTVVIHTNPDGDCVGCAAGMMAIMESLGNGVRYASSDDIPKRLEFLVKDRERVTAPSGDIIAVDVASPAQLGKLSYLAEEGRISLMLDHHEVGVPYADNLIIRGMSSAGEVLYLVARELEAMGKIKLDKKIATPIYAAISSDSGRFSYSATTSDTYRRAAELLDTGVDFADINHNIFNSKPIEQITADAIVASKIRLECNGKVAFSTISKEDIEKAGLKFIHFDTAIDVVRQVLGAEIAFIIKETPDGKIKASIRGRHLTVSDIAAHFGGGGHALAAGCSFDVRTVDEAAELLVGKIKEKIGG